MGTNTEPVGEPSGVAAVDAPGAPPKPSADDALDEPTGRGTTTWVVLAMLGVLIAVGWFLLPAQREDEARVVEREPLPVAVIEVPTGIVRAILRAEGTVRAVRREFLAFEAAGRVVEVAVEEDGRPIRPGTKVQGPRDGQPGLLLARVDSRDQSGDLVVQEVGVKQSKQDVESAKASVAQARSDVQLAQTRLTRTEGLYEAGDASLSQLEEARASVNAAEANLRARRAALEATRAGVEGAEARLGKAEVSASRTEIRAPFDGIVVARNISVGDYATTNMVDRSSESRQLATAPFTVIDPTELEVTVELPAFEAARVKPGQLAAIADVRSEFKGPPPQAAATPVAPSDLPVSLGRVFSVARAVDAEARTVQVRIRTRHNVERLQHGQFVTCVIVTDEREDAVALPMDVLSFRDGKAHVFVVDPARGVVARREVVPELHGTRAIAVKAGVSAGDLVVSAGLYRLTDGAPVEVTVRETADIGWQGRVPEIEP